jgi:NAD(P)-dependent dehydrogenase (short-subunit alcohol dehydrogenase family)
MPRVVFITGTSRGLGRELAQVFLSAGDYVVATARDPSTLSFNSTTPTNYLPLKLDVTSPSDIEEAFTATVDRFGRIDVVINNAAFGLVGPLETCSDEQVRSQFDTNFFPVVTITRKAIQIMRTQSPCGGTILQLSTVGASFGVPLVGIMSASKKAVEAFTESAQQEMKPEWGIKLSSVQFSPMDTDAHQNGKNVVFGDVALEAHEHVDAHAFLKSVTPSIEPKKAAVAMEQLLHLEGLPGKVMFIGEEFRRLVKDKIEKDLAEGTREDIVELAKSCEK